MISVCHPIVRQTALIACSLVLCLAVASLPSEVSAGGPDGSVGDSPSAEQTNAGSETASPSSELAILAVLEARHAVPSRDELEALIPNAEAELIAVASDTQTSAWARQRAISLLSGFRSEAAMGALARLTHSDDADVRAMSLYTLARAFADVGPELLVLRLELVARTDAEERVVEYAIRGLRWIDVPAADAALARLAIDGPNVDLATSVRERRQARLSAPSGTPLGE